MKAKIIKTEAEYQTALAHLEGLMDAQPDTPEEEDLELFAMLIDSYEQESFPIGLPDPVAAIEFRMEQQGLTRKDLEPYLGSQSKVSEVLNGKRPLSLAMIRALHTGLGIPAEVLLRQPGQTLAERRYNYRDYPFTEMFNAGYFTAFNGRLTEAKEQAEELLNDLFAVFQGHTPQRIYCRTSEGQPDELALQAWQARVLHLAANQSLPPFSRADLTLEFIRDVLKLSSLTTGPLLAQERLQQRGLPLVILPHLPRTYLDGACFNSTAGRPVVGLTLRHDRLDNFWFTLAHELAHVFLHLDGRDVAFFDNTERNETAATTPQEIEANALASELLIPAAIWQREKPALNSKAAIAVLANQLSLCPAIVAGRLRWEANNYNNFDELLGRKTVRKLFAV